ncbi:Alpha/Beta hydrolase protein [Aspergillus spectabilis]
MSVIHNSSTWPDYGTIDPQLENAARPDTSGVDKSEIRIPVRDGSRIRAILYKPQTKPVAGSPLVVLFHGGGWCIGLPEMEEPNALLLVKNHGAVVVSVGYRKAPGHRFPTAIHDSWDALKWCSKNASKLDVIPSKGFLIGGGSAGANIAAVLSHLARDEKLSPPLTAVFLNIPFTCAPEVIPERYRAEFTSYEQNANAPGLDVKAINFFREYYQADANSELFSPMLWPSGHKGLPKTYLQICGLDPLRDDGLLYERELRNAKVPTRVDVYPGVPHGFEGMFPHLDLAMKAVKDREISFDWLLETA